MKTLLEQLLEASKTGVNEFKQTRKESGRTFKDDADEILTELRKSVEKGKGFAKETHEKAAQEFKNRSQRKSETDSADETCDFPFCGCDETCKKEKDYDEQDVEQDTVSLSDLLKSLFDGEFAEEVINVKHVMNLIDDTNETTFVLLEDVEDGVINTSKTKNAIFLLSLLKFKLINLVNYDDEDEINELEQDIIDLADELDNVNNYLQSSELTDLIYAVDVVFE